MNPTVQRAAVAVILAAILAHDWAAARLGSRKRWSA